MNDDDDKMEKIKKAIVAAKKLTELLRKIPMCDAAKILEKINEKLCIDAEGVRITFR